MLISNIHVVLLHHINVITTSCLYYDDMDGSFRVQTEFMHIKYVPPSWKTCMHTPHAQHKTIDTYNYAWDLFSRFLLNLFMKVQGNPKDHFIRTSN